MWQDDYIYNNTCFSKIVDAINAGGIWGACGAIHLQYDNYGYTLVPRISQEFIEKRSNTMGCPSLCFFKYNKTDFFDENLILVNDFDFSYRMNKKYGNPIVIPEPLISVRIWEGSVTSTILTSEAEQKEFEYMKNKH